jgi:hypothetical protein
MYSVLVLGLIPGTNIEISFQAWLLVTGFLFLFISIAWLEYKQRKNVIWLPAHYPKDANQLHQRGV